MKARDEGAIAGAIIVLGLALAAVWVFRVPFFQSPDESAHADYAFTVFTTHALIRARDARPATDVHPLVRYLEDASGFRAMRYNQDGRVPAGYESARFYQAVDAGAPHVRADFLAHHGGRVPYVARHYAYLYYLLDALAIGLAALATGGSVVAEFFAARLFNVVLLAISLGLTWRTLRELEVEPILRLGMLAAIAWFPLTSWVSAYVQSDNLAFTAVALLFYLSVRLRREPDVLRAALWLGLALGLLVLTKPQFFVAVAVPALADRTLRSARHLRSLQGWLGYLGLVAGPAIVLGLSTLWVSSGVGHQFVQSVSANANPLGFTWAKGFLPFLGYAVEQLANAWRTTFYYGLPFVSYWGMIPWTGGHPFEFGTPAVTEFVFAVIGLLTQVVAVMIALRTILVWGRLATIARRRSSYGAFRLLASDVMLNSYFLFGAIIFAVLLSTGGQLGTQGRYWLPFILPAILCAVRYGPQLFGRAQTRHVVGAALLIGLLLYSVVGTVAGFATLEARFYRPPGVLHGDEYFARITRVGPYDLYEPHAEPLRLKRSGHILIDGWAIDSRTGRPALAVQLVVDGSRRIPAHYGTARPDVVDRLHDDDVLNSGFLTSLDDAHLSAGEHVLSLAVGERDRSQPHPSRAVVHVFVGDR